MVFRKKTSSRKYARKTPIFRKVNTAGMIAKKRRSNLVKLIKDVQISQSEMKFITSTIETGVLNHNSVTEFHCWGPTGNVFNVMPSIGTGDGSRIGDRIHAKGIMLRAQVQLTWDRKSTRLAVYWVPHNSEQGSPSTDLFHNVSGMTILDPLQKKRFPNAKLVGIYKTDPNDQSSGTYGGSVGTPQAGDQKIIFFKSYVPLNQKIYFKTDGSAVPTNLKEYGTFCLAPFDKTLALSTDNVIMSGTLNATLYYKDI